MNADEMNPDKSERKLRRSSILKPPKVRQPLQNVELALSSAENSPTTITTKAKRRVSFAEKKHVKEFCDSMEQGTLWDNTYEESELSQIRNSENSNTDENIRNDCKLLTTEKSQISVVTKTSISLTESISTGNKKDSRPIERSLSTTERVFGVSSSKENPLLLERSDSYPAQVAAAIGFEKSANIVPLTMQDDDCNNISMDETLTKNISVAPTHSTSVTLSKTTPILRTSFNSITDIDFLKKYPTTSIGPLRSISDISEDTIVPTELKDSQTVRTKTQDGIVIYQDTSMEVKEAMSNQVPITSKHQPTTFGYKKLNKGSILVTEEKTTFQIKTVDAVTKILGLSKQNLNEPNENEVNLRPERMPIFDNKSVQSRNTAQNILSINHLENDLNFRELTAGKTKTFHNESMNLTEVVQNIQISEKPESIEPEQTTVFHDKSLELTEVIQNVKTTCQLQKQASEKTTIVQDKSADLDGILQNLPSLEQVPRISHEQTTFHNKSLDFTEVVQSRDSDRKLQPPLQKSSMKTINLQDQLIDITGIMRNSASIKNLEKGEPDQKTTCFQNQPVAMTEIVRDYQSYEKLPPEKTTIFHNQSVDMTEVVQSCQTYKNHPPEKTTIFNNESVDITEVVRSRQSYEEPSPEKTTIFHDQSVDMTEVVRSRQNYEEPSPEKTTIFHDQSVDMTEVVRSRQNYEEPSPEKTTIFHDQSVDMTEVIRSHQTYEKPSSEKITIFHDRSVNMNRPLRTPSSEQSDPAVTTPFQNQSVNVISEVVQSNKVVNESVNATKTATFPDESIAFTEIIPSICFENPNRNDFDLEIAPSSPQSTTVLDNSFTGHNNIEEVNGNETSDNQYPKLIEAISRDSSISKLISRDPCTLAKEHISKQKSLDSEPANELIACIDVKTSDPEVRSPVPKRMKSLGRRQSLDLTAAVPFVMYRKLARHRPGDINSVTCNPPSGQVYCGTASTTEGFSTFSMEIKEVPVGSMNVDLFGESPVRPVETVTHEARQGTTNFQNRSMEMTETVPYHCSSKSTSQVCTDCTGDVDWQRQQDDTIRHDDSMEITRAISGILKVNPSTYHDNSMEFTKAVSRYPITENSTVLNENHDSVNRRSHALPDSQSGTMLFRTESMELPSRIHRSSQPIAICCTNAEEIENSCPNVIAEVEIDGRAMVYCDNSVEHTRTAQSSLQGQDKENCPLSTEYPQFRSTRRPEKQSRIGISKNEWLQIVNSVPFESSQENEQNKTGSVGSEIQNQDAASEQITGVVPFLSSQENEENEVKPIESEKQRLDTESDDITGVVALTADFKTEQRDGCILKEVGSAIGFGVEEMEMTERVQWPLGRNVEKPLNVFDNVDRQSGLPSIEVFSTPDQIQHRHSQVAKELFGKSVSINRTKSADINPTATSETADLATEIRKLAETFAVSNSANESGFDQATFLRQQARCMEDYEANSTSSQEFHSETMSLKNNMSIMGKTDPLDPTKSVSLTDTVGYPNLALPKENRVNSPDSKTANISIRSDDNSQYNGPSRMIREDYDRSLEELRCRAYSVSKFRPEVTGLELTGAISLIEPGNLHKSIFDEEPPSFVFSDSVATNAITDCSAVADTSSTKSNPSIGRNEVRDRMSLQSSPVSVPDITERVEPLCNDTPEIDTISVESKTIIVEGDDDNNAGVLNIENIERAERRSQTIVIKRPSIDPTILISSSTELETELHRERLSGLTTAAEFSSESPDGPNEKIRRRDSGLPIEKRTLVLDEVANETELLEADRFWRSKTFANSTVIGEDYTRQFVRQGIEETSVMQDRLPSNELLSEIFHDVDQIVNKGSEVEEVIEITTELHDVPKSPYTVLKETIESLAEKPETIWKIKRLDEKIIAFTFFSRSLVVGIYLKENAIWNSTDAIEVIASQSQLKEDGSPPNMRLAHRLIMKKISSASLTDSYKTYKDIPRMLEYVTTEVKLGMDFMFELDRLSDHMVMDISGYSITFTVRTLDVNSGIILNITMEIKPFEEISPNDITIAFLLGREKISENDIKRLIANVKRDHRFLRFYINDVRSYIELAAESGFSIKKKTK